LILFQHVDFPLFILILLFCINFIQSVAKIAVYINSKCDDVKFDATVYMYLMICLNSTSIYSSNCHIR